MKRLPHSPRRHKTPLLGFWYWHPGNGKPVITCPSRPTRIVYSNLCTRKGVQQWGDRLISSPISRAAYCGCGKPKIGRKITLRSIPVSASNQYRNMKDLPDQRNSLQSCASATLLILRLFRCLKWRPKIWSEPGGALSESPKVSLSITNTNTTTLCFTAQIVPLRNTARAVPQEATARAIGNNPIGVTIDDYFVFCYRAPLFHERNYPNDFRQV